MAHTQQHTLLQTHGFSSFEFHHAHILSLSLPSLIPLLSPRWAVSHKDISSNGGFTRRHAKTAPMGKAAHRSTFLYYILFCFCIIIVHMIVWSKTNLQANKLPRNCDNWQIDSSLLVVHIIILSSTSKNTVSIVSFCSVCVCVCVCLGVNVWANVPLINHFLVYVLTECNNECACVCLWMGVCVSVSLEIIIYYFQLRPITINLLKCNY